MSPPDVRSVRVDNPGPMTLDGTRVYLIGRSRAVLLDPGPDREGIEDLWRELSGDAEVETVALTHGHPDHAGAALRAADLFGARLAASAATLRGLSADGRSLDDGAEVPVDGGASTLRAVETPGHSPDHLCYFRPSDGVLLTGDLVLGRGSSLVGHPEGSVSDCLASLERLMELGPDLLLPGHGPDVEDAGERLAAYRDHRRERTRQVRRALEAGDRSVEAIRRRVYGDGVPEGLEWAAAATVRAHLVHLEELGEELPDVAGR